MDVGRRGSPLSRDHSATDRIERARWRGKKEEDLTTDGDGGEGTSRRGRVRKGAQWMRGKKMR